MNQYVTRTRFAEKPFKADQPDVEEISSVRDDDIFRGWIGERLINPDKILETESRGDGLQFYDVLERDCHVASVLQQRKLSVIGKEWSIEPPADSKDPRAPEIADFVRRVFLGLGTAMRRDYATAGLAGFDQFRLDLLDGTFKGFAVGELLWRVRETDGAVVLSEIKGRNPRRFVFDIENRLRLLNLQNALEGELLPPRKFVVLTFARKYDDPYGTGLAQKLWWPVWFKKHGVKFWAMFMEKFGMPTVVGKYPPGTDEPKRKALLSAIKAIQQETGVTIPEGMTLELLEAQRQGSLNTYADFIRLWNDEISKAVLGQTLTTELSGSTGSYAASQTHQEVRGEIVKADADLLCEAINNQVIPPLVDFNFSNVTDYPKCWIKTEADEDENKKAERDDKLVRLGVPVPVSYFRRTYDLPEPQGDEPVVSPAAPAALASQPQPAGQAADLVRQYRDVELLEGVRRIEQLIGQEDA
jgi:phage gp29-like protein